jgi:hypothetical protein
VVHRLRSLLGAAGGGFVVGVRSGWGGPEAGVGSWLTCG